MVTLAAPNAPPTPTEEPPRSRRRLRSVGAVLAGFAATFAVTTLTDVALHALGVFPPFPARMDDALLVLALAYRLPFNALGGYVAARLAPSRPFQHALALGLSGIAVASLGAVLMGKYGPAWYSLANIVVALPCAWLGGRLERSVTLGGG